MPTLLNKQIPQDPSGLFGERDYEAETERFREEYDSIYARDLDPRDYLPPSNDLNTVRDLTNIVLGDEMASVGASLDRDGLHWELEKAKNFWAEHPVRATLATLTTAIPMASAAMKQFRAAKVVGITDDMVLAQGMVDDTVDIARMGEKEREVLRKQHYTLTQNADLEERIALDQASVKDIATYKMHKWFGNSYMEHSDPRLWTKTRREWMETNNRLLGDNGIITDFLKKMPEDEEIGTSIARYLDNPRLLSEIPKKSRAWAVRLGDELRDTQSTMVREGLIANEEAAQVGDTWFSMLREGTKKDFGPTTTILERTNTGKVRVMAVPRTASPNLLKRSMPKEELTEFMRKQQASEWLSKGRTDDALALLQGDAYTDVRRLIDQGDKGTAIKILGEQGKVDFTPKSLTFNSLFAQKQLLNTYRYVRDIALDPSITITSDQLMRMGPAARRNWQNLDKLDGADRLRRMASIGKGEPVNALGHVPKRVYSEMQELVGMDRSNWKSGVGDLTQALVAMYKTAKTAFNAPTHVQNVIGNNFFLLNAGVNPLSPEFLKLQGLSLKAINSMQRAARKGVGSAESLSDVSKLKLDSLAGGKKIDVVEELQSPELKDILELSSLMTAEGIGVLQNIIKNARTGSPVKALVSGYNKVLKGGRLDRLADLYMAEDGMAKMAYFLHLRQRGLSRAASLNEVGRRLPMYNSVGEVPGMLRSSVLPWITFPIEASRIMKNNLVDHPLKTAMILQIPEMMQVAAYGAGRAGWGEAMSAQEIEERKTQLPAWAHRPASFMTPWRDKNGDFRAAMLDWLPYSSAMPSTIHKDAPAIKKLPFGLDEPIPILGAAYMALTGKDAWGREIPSASLPGKITSMMLNLTGMIAPPLMQKYFFNPTDPKFGYSVLQDTGNAINPYTMKEGDPVLDLFMNRVIGFKSYASSPEQQLANESFKLRDLRSLRGRYTREWAALLKSGDTDTAARRLRDIHATFVQESGDPALAQQKFSAWLTRHWRDVGKHPQLRGISKEELESRMSGITQAAGQQRTRTQRELYEAYAKELGRRGRTSGGGRNNPLFGAGGFGGGGGTPSFGGGFGR